MASSKGEVGRLYVAVFANTTKAVDALTRLEVKANQTAAAVNRVGKTGNQGSQDAQVRKTSDAYTKMGKSAKGAADGVKKVGDQSKKTRMPMNQLQTSMYRLSQSFINLRYGNPIGVFAGLTQSLSSLGRALTSFTSKGGPFGIFVAALAAIPIAATAAAAGFTLLAGAIGKFGLKEAANIEMLRIQYEGLLESATRGRAEVDYILELGKTSVVPTEGLLEANRLLLAYGVTADQTRQKLVQFFSDFGSATGLSAARLQDMAYALGQVEAQGKANQIDLRQLANAGLNLSLVYQKVAEQQRISVAAAKELTSEGKLTASILIPAVVALGDNYAEAAEKARNSVRGILANLKDIVQINIATGFEEALTKVKPLLKKVEEFAEAFDFRAVGEGFTGILSGIAQGFGNVDMNAKELATFISRGLAESFRFMGQVAGNVFLFINKTIVTNKKLVVELTGLYDRLNRAFLELQRATAKLGAALTPDFWGPTRDTIDYLDDKIAELDKTIEETTETTADLQAELDQLNDIEIKIPVLFSLEMTGNAALEAGWMDYLRSQQIALGAEGPKRPVPVPVSGDDEDGGGAGKAKKDAIDAAKEYGKLNAVLTQFNEIVSKPLGSNSAIEKLAFASNADGLSVGSTSGVLSEYKSLTAAVETFYGTLIELAPKAEKAGFRDSKNLALQGLKSQFGSLYEAAEASERAAQAFSDRTKQEIDTARTRIGELGNLYTAEVEMTAKYYDGLIAGAEQALDDATRAYETANSKLQEMLAARQQFLSGVQESAFSFVNSMTSVSETLASVTDLDNLGSFSSVQEETTANFKKQMEDRLEIVKQFALDVKSLQSRGLDEGLLRQLVEAGPESGGALASVLADESDAAIAEINALQSDLSSTVGDLQSTLSAAWYDEGIAQQQAFTNRLAVQQQAATEQLAALKALKEQELADLKASYDARVKEQEDLIANLEAGQAAWQITEKESLEAAAETTGKIISDIQAGVDKLGKKGDGSLYKYGKNAIDALIAGMEKREPAALATAQRIADRISSTIANAFEIRSPSRVMMGYGENISEGLAIGIENGLSRVDMASARLAGAAMPTQQGAPSVKVFIGDRELRDMVDVQISDASGRDLDTVYAGRRDF